MPRGLILKLLRKAGAFTSGQLGAGEVGMNTAAGRIEFSPDGSTVLSAGGNVLYLGELTTLPTPVPDTELIFAWDVDGISALFAMSPTGLVTALQPGSPIFRNESGATILKGRAVCIVGVTTTAYGPLQLRSPLIALASNTSDSLMPAVGVTLQNIANNSSGRVMEIGRMGGLTTSSFPAQSRLYVGTNGVLTATRPADRVQRVGLCTRSHSTEGQIDVDIQGMFSVADLTLLPNVGTTIQHTLIWNASSGLTNKYEPNPRPPYGKYRYVGPTDPTKVGVTMSNGDYWEQTF